MQKHTQDIDLTQKVILDNKLESLKLMNNSLTFIIHKINGKNEQFDITKIYTTIKRACFGFESNVSIELIMQEIIKNLSNNTTTHTLQDAMILAATSFIEHDPSYSHVSARLLLQKLSKEVIGTSVTLETYEVLYRQSFINSIYNGIDSLLLDHRIKDFDIPLLASYLKIDRDDLFEYLGLRTLYERYFLKINTIRTELPQSFFMRIAMGLAILEPNKNERAIEFYNIMSKMYFLPSTPTLLHAATTHPQLSSCYLTTINDDLFHIFKCLGDNAQMSRWSGGVANDWTPLRGTGAYIKSIKSGSQGLIPFLKIANDVTAAINRSGSRRGATVAYLETWHYDIEDFLDLKRNTGDERRRAHDMNTANWIPDLFMKRVESNESWTLFSPDETPDLHDLYGIKFEKQYKNYELLASQGKIKLYKTIDANELWKKILTRIFETGHPWITFKDACNIRSPQDHVGIIHSSNLCTEITLNTSATETAVCNLGSINLSQHITDSKIDKTHLAQTIETAIRMLDNVIDINFYPTPEGDISNKRHRPIGLGLMGYQDALFKLNINFTSQEAIHFSDSIGEFFSYHAILASSKLAKERGTYATFKNSKWDKNILPVDTLNLLEKERELPITTNRIESLDWSPVRQHIQEYGMRNSNTMAIAPTATIANIAGCFPCIEPIYKNLYVKSNMGGEFTIINKYLVNDLKKLCLWNKQTLDLIKYYDGNIEHIDTIPLHIKDKYKEAFQIDAEHLIEMTAARGKWIDQSQSHNIFMAGVSGKKLDSIYKKAWHAGLKSTYYLRTLGASQIEKSTLDAKTYGFTQTREYKTATINNSDSKNNASILHTIQTPLTEQSSCNIINADCESCQ